MAILSGVLLLFLRVPCAAACILADPAETKPPCHSGRGPASLRVQCPDALAAGAAATSPEPSAAWWHPAEADSPSSLDPVARLPEALCASPPAGPEPRPTPLRI
jgi:hypothetical protein